MEYQDMTDAELIAAMNETDADSDLRVVGFQSPETPHYEYFRRAIIDCWQ